MKFSCKVEIELPRDIVVQLFDNPDNMPYWQDDFIAFEHISGTPGQEGSTAKVIYKRVELLETVLENDLPNAFHGSYEGSWGKNLMNNYFEETGRQSTIWKAEVEYIAMENIMMKIMGRFFPGMFRKQTQKWMDQFKVFAERNGTSRS